MLGPHKIMTVLHAVACPIVFLLFYGLGWLGGVFKIMKNYLFLVFFCHLGPFFQVLDR